MDHFMFVIMGMLGSILYIFMWAKTSCDISSFEAIRHVIVGTIVGFVYYYLHTDYNFPNGIMTLVVGYMGPDFIEALIEHLNLKLNENDKPPKNEK